MRPRNGSREKIWATGRPVNIYYTRWRQGCTPTAKPFSVIYSRLLCKKMNADRLEFSFRLLNLTTIVNLRREKGLINKREHKISY